MLLKKNGESIYFEYMLKLYLDDKEFYFATGAIPEKEITAYMSIPSSISKGIDPVECTGSIGSVSLDIINDNDCKFSKLLASYNKASGMYFRKAEIYLVKINETTLVYTGLLRNIKPKDVFETSYTIEIADLMSELYKKPTLLNKSDKKYADWFNSTLTNKPVNEFNVVVTKYLNTNNKIELKLKGHPLDVAKFLIKNMYKDTVFVNTESFDTAKSDTYTTELSKCEFLFTEYVKDTMDYITKNILRICNVFPYLNKNGELCIIRQKPLSVLQDTETYFLDEDDIIKMGSKEINYDKVINHLLIVRGNTQIKDYYFDGDSYNQFKKFMPENPKEIILNRGTMTDSEVVLIGNDVARNLFSMFSISYQTVSFEVELTEFDRLIAGDTIGLTHRLLINSSNGERGVKELSVNLDLYCKLDVDYWGGFLPTYIGTTFLDENMQEKSYNVSEIVTTLWYNSVSEANLRNKNYSDFLRG